MGVWVVGLGHYTNQMINISRCQILEKVTRKYHVKGLQTNEIFNILANICS